MRRDRRRQRRSGHVPRSAREFPLPGADAARRGAARRGAIGTPSWARISLPHRLRCLQDAALFPHRGAARHPRHRHPYARSRARSSSARSTASPARRSAATRTCGPRTPRPCCCGTIRRRLASSNAPTKAGALPDPFPETLVEIEGPSRRHRPQTRFRIEITADGNMRTETLEQPMLHWTSAPWHVAQESGAHHLPPHASGRSRRARGGDVGERQSEDVRAGRGGL